MLDITGIDFESDRLVEAALQGGGGDPTTARILLGEALRKIDKFYC